MRRPRRPLRRTPNAPFVGLAAAEDPGDSRFEARTLDLPLWLRCS
jgi:hypothetical protein